MSFYTPRFKHNIWSTHKMKNVKYIFCFLLAIVFLWSCDGNKNKITIIDNENFLAEEGNEKLKVVSYKAQSSLDYFIDELNKHSRDTNYWFSAKTKFEGRDRVDHIWFNTIEFNSNDLFMGILHTEPDWSNTLKINDTIFIHRSNIEDWYIENESKNIVEGDFTQKVLFDNE